MKNEMPILDERDSKQVLNELLARRPAYLSKWSPSSGSPGWALIQIFSRYAQVVIDRLNMAPKKNFLAFLDMLGIDLIPARGARAPVVFESMPNGVNGRITRGVRLGAEVPEASEPVLFETESPMAVAGAKLVEVKTLWPTLDVYADHSLDAAGRKSFTLFEPHQAVAHELYLAHDTIFAFSSEATLEIQFELSNAGNEPLSIIWEYWDGQIWRPFRSFSGKDITASQDGTNGLTHSGVVKLRAECGESVKTKINGVEAHWIRGRLIQPLPPDPARVLPVVDRLRVRAVMAKSTDAGLQPDAAFSNGLRLDLSNTFYPFGQQPHPGSAFYFSSAEAFAKPGAKITIESVDAETPLDNTGTGATNADAPILVAEYWNGTQWVDTGISSIDLNSLISNGYTLNFNVPQDLSPTIVGGEEGLWLRMCITNGGFYRTRPVDNILIISETVPPALSDFVLGYEYRPPWEQAQHCLTYNDFQFDGHSADAVRPGGYFSPFRPVADTTPALYLGFDRPLPNELISLFFDLQEAEAETPPLVWEAWDGESWHELTVNDETADLRLPGVLSFLIPDVAPRPQTNLIRAGGENAVLAEPLDAAHFDVGDAVVLQMDRQSEVAVIRAVDNGTIVFETQLQEIYNGGTLTLAAPARFGTPRDWVRARLKAKGIPAKTDVNGIYLNAGWAVQVQTIEDELLGSSTGQPDQVYFFKQTPLLPGEAIEVRELDGPRAQVEYPILREELLAADLSDDDIRKVLDPRSGEISEVWVTWKSRPHLYFSNPHDRHYMIERAGGRLIFGDGQNSRIPTAGANNIRAKRYQAGGGLAGNVLAGTIEQLLGPSFSVQAVSNPCPADGGAGGESEKAVLVRGPRRLRHRGSSLAARDYEALACEASPGVAIARALPATMPNRRPAPGWVTVIIVPQSLAPEPQPSFELRRQVHAYLSARAPITLDEDRLTVIGPTYLPIGVNATVVPRQVGEAGLIEEYVRERLALFFHPLSGGPEGKGWPFGRDVHLSDVAAVLEAVEGVDYVERLELYLSEAPVGECVEVPDDRIVIAGPCSVEMKVADG